MIDARHKVVISAPRVAPRAVSAAARVITTGDFGYCRAYVAKDGSSASYAEDNVPYRPKSWLKIAKDRPDGR